MIKICHLVDGFDIGGLEKTVEYIVLGLDKKKYHQQVWCLRKKGILAQDLEKEGVLVRAFNIEGGLKISYLLKLIRELKEENFKIIHAHGIFPSIWGILAAIFAGVRVRIVHCQNLYYGISRKERIKSKSLSYFATKIIAVSEAVKISLVEFVGIDSKKIIVIYNSSPKMKLQSTFEKKEIRKIFGLKENDFVVGSISRLEEHKGHIFIIEAIKKCITYNANCKCIFAGDGRATESLKLKVRSLGLEDSIIFLGWRKDIENLFLIMDVFIQPSTLREGLPLALAEAASAGLPLIATDVGGNPEIVKNGVNGFIIPPKDSEALVEKIKYLMENIMVRQRMGESSRKIWQEKFTLEEMLSKIDSLYQNSIKRL